MLTQMGYDTGILVFVLMSRTTLPERKDRGDPGSVPSREGGAAWCNRCGGRAETSAFLARAWLRSNVLPLHRVSNRKVDSRRRPRPCRERPVSIKRFNEKLREHYQAVCCSVELQDGTCIPKHREIHGEHLPVFFG